MDFVLIFFSLQIREELVFNHTPSYPFDADDDDDERVHLNDGIRVSLSGYRSYIFIEALFDRIPFRSLLSENNVIIDSRSVRGSKNRQDVLNVEDANHCEFVLRNFG